MCLLYIIHLYINSVLKRYYYLIIYYSNIITAVLSLIKKQNYRRYYRTDVNVQDAWRSIHNLYSMRLKNTKMRKKIIAAKFLIQLRH